MRFAHFLACWAINALRASSFTLEDNEDVVAPVAPVGDAKAETPAVEVAAPSVKEVIRVLKALAKRVDVRNRKEDAIFEEFGHYCLKGSTSLEKSLKESQVELPQLQLQLTESDRKRQALLEEMKVEDSVQLFTSDTLKGGAKKPELVKVLCGNSGPDVDWLVDKFDLDMSLLARLGGHSAPRTHRGKERFPGMTITYALIQMVEKISERSDLARIINKAKVKQLLTKAGAVCGVTYEKTGKDFTEEGPVILATGGFGADFTDDSLLAKYRPDLLHLPTTNGDHTTGDGIKMGEAIGARSIDLEWVQVHPTGLVEPDDPEAKIKFLAAEALRGVGGLVINAEGQRFCNELGRRDYVTGEMWKSKPPFRLILNKAASDEIIWHCKHYTGRGVMKFYESGEALCKDMNIPLSTLEATHQSHFESAKKQEKDPEGGPFPAYPSGKTWDEPSGLTGAGKKFFHNIIDGSKVKTEPFYSAIITPVIHYCMGGLEIDEDSAVVSQSGKAIPGLYAAGEVAGGVHGNNRLGGNSLLDCVVFGRVAGKHCAKYMLGDKFKAMDLKELSGGGLAADKAPAAKL